MVIEILIVSGVNDNPKEMIAGEIISPMFNITNTKIISRHIYSVVLSMFLKENPEILDYLGDKISFEKIKNMLRDDLKEIV